MKSQVFNEDCMEVMKRYPAKYFDLAVVDPPYGIGVNINMGRRSGDKPSEYHKFHGEDKHPPTKEYFTELFRVSKEQIIWGGNYMIENLYSSACWLMWDKKFSEDVTFAQFELAWTSFKSSCKKFDKSPQDRDRIHPTQKPVDLYNWIFKNYAKEGFKILDTHLGSGSSRIAADRAGLEFVGCELDKDYFEAAEQRFKDYKAQLKLF
jgi:site-specific DNA-methyltransferase (adenine-specific)